MAEHTLPTAIEIAEYREIFDVRTDLPRLLDAYEKLLEAAREMKDVLTLCSEHTLYKELDTEVDKALAAAKEIGL